METVGFRGPLDLGEYWLETAFASKRILPLDDRVAGRAIGLRQDSRMSLADAIIAATALVHRLPLVTRNVDDLRHLLNAAEPASRQRRVLASAVLRVGERVVPG